MDLHPNVIVREVVCVIGILLHSIGLYLIACIGRNVMNNNQRILLANLSAIEILLLTTELLKFVFTQASSNADAINVYILMAEVNGLVIYYNLIMIYFTVNRFLEVYLNIKYTMICTSRRCWNICGLTIAVCLTGAITAELVWHLRKVDYRLYVIKYAFPTIDCIFVLVATCTYGYLFTAFQRQAVPAHLKPKQKKSKIRQQRLNVLNSQLHGLWLNSLQKCSRTIKGRAPIEVAAHEPAARTLSGRIINSFELYRRSNFVMVTIIVLSFIAFALIPDLVTAILVREEGSPVLPYLQTMFMVGFVIDAITYIFVHNGMRRKLVKKLQFLKKERKETHVHTVSVISSSTV